MPIYEYGCKECGHTFTEWSAMDDRKVPCLYPCPKCDQKDCINILLGNTSFVLKGGGWYKDGYSKPNNN